LIAADGACLVLQQALVMRQISGLACGVIIAAGANRLIQKGTVVRVHPETGPQRPHGVRQHSRAEKIAPPFPPPLLLGGEGRTARRW
jgi:hypothetical protein